MMVVATGVASRPGTANFCLIDYLRLSSAGQASSKPFLSDFHILAVVVVVVVVVVDDVVVVVVVIITIIFLFRFLVT